MYSINDLEDIEKPREKANRFGIDSLSNIELFALLLGHGSKNYSILNLCNDLLCKFGNVKGVLNAPKEELISIKGISNTTALKILAVSELYKRTLSIDFSRKFDIQLALKKYSLILNNSDDETFIVIGLNTKKKILIEKVLFKGSINGYYFPINSILKLLISSGSKSYYLIHNHLHSFLPSDMDIKTTLILKEKSKELGIILKDHFIISPNGYYSFFQKNIK